MSILNYIIIGCLSCCFNDKHFYILYSANDMKILDDDVNVVATPLSGSHREVNDIARA